MENTFIAAIALALGLILGYVLGRRDNKYENPLDMKLVMSMGPHMKYLYDLYDAVTVAKLGLSESQMHRMFFNYLNDELNQKVSQDTAIDIYNILILMDDPAARQAKMNSSHLQSNVLPTIKHVVKPFLEEKRASESGVLNG